MEILRRPSWKLVALSLLQLMILGLFWLEPQSECPTAFNNTVEVHPPVVRVKEKARSEAGPAPAYDLAPTFDAKIYRSKNPSLRLNSDAEALHHYNTTGMHEGLVSSAVENTETFLAQLAPARSVLEIGPFCRPAVKSAVVKYADVLSQEGLRKRIGSSSAICPHVHYVIPKGNIAAIDDVFDVVFSSHNIEHQHDLVGYFQSVEQLLTRGGRHFLIVPDKRYIFDSPLPLTTMADVLDAHYHPITRHTLRSALEHRAVAFFRHAYVLWDMQRLGQPPTSPYQPRLVEDAYAEWLRPTYLDVHKWNFTPESFAHIVDNLRDMGLITFTVERLYHTLRNTIEFRAILRAG